MGPSSGHTSPRFVVWTCLSGSDRTAWSAVQPDG